MDQIPSIQCQRCGKILPPDALACNRCGLFTHAQELQVFAQNAYAAEQLNPQDAVQIWRDILTLLPRESQQYHDVRRHIGVLTGEQQFQSPTDIVNYDRRVRPKETFARSAFKTIGSLILSAAIYSTFWGWDFAIGFVLLILVHEMGHVFAIKYYKLRAGSPIFIPFMGALIDLREAPPNAKVEAVIGIGGPILGAVGAIACYLVGSSMETSFGILLVELSFYGLFLNLFNLLPVPPLDGGRVTAALSPKIWILGVLAIVAWIVQAIRTGTQVPWILVVLLVIAFPRIWATIRGRARVGNYYHISRRATWVIGILYVSLAATLAYFLFMAYGKMRVMNMTPF